MGRDAEAGSRPLVRWRKILRNCAGFLIAPARIPLDEHALLSVIEQRLREKNRNVIVVVSEGAHHADGSSAF